MTTGLCCTDSSDRICFRGLRIKEMPDVPHDPRPRSRLDIPEDFQSVLQDHSRHPRRFGAIANSDLKGNAVNAACGDRYCVYLKISGEVISNCQFTGNGCSISMASASMMAESMCLITSSSGILMTREFLSQFSRGQSVLGSEVLGELNGFTALGLNRMRLNCLLLPWRALLSALDCAAAR